MRLVGEIFALPSEYDTVTTHNRQFDVNQLVLESFTRVSTPARGSIAARQSLFLGSSNFLCLNQAYASSCRSNTSRVERSGVLLFASLLWLRCAAPACPL